MTDLLATIPVTVQQASFETIPWAFDATPLLGMSEVISAPSTQLLDLATWVAYPAGLIGAIGLAGNIITQTVTALRAGHTYLLIYIFTVTAGKILSSAARIEVPY